MSYDILRLKCVLYYFTKKNFTKDKLSALEFVVIVVSMPGHNVIPVIYSARHSIYRDKYASKDILSVPYITANIDCKSRNLPNTDTRNYSIDLR